MLLTDPNGPVPSQPRRSGSRRISHVPQFVAPAILIFTFATFGATNSRAQDQQSQQSQSVAEAARKERARKEELQKRAKHVYTEEDLKHPNILTPEDRAQVEARRNECAQKNNCSPTGSQNSPATLDANSPAPGTSLGEVARQLRKQKELQALKPKQTEPFHLPFSTPALASPILPERPVTRPPAQPVLHPKPSSPKTSSNVFLRDPFSAVPVPAHPAVRPPEIRKPEVRRPEIQPKVRDSVLPKVNAEIRPKVRGEILPTVRPNIHPDFSKSVRPTLHARGRRTSPPQPRISCRLVEPILLFPPMQPAVPANPAQPVAPATPPSTIRPTQPVLPSGAVGSQRTISVQPGDSLWKLAQQNLGRGNRWPELLAVNPGIVDPNQIRAGARLVLPAAVAASSVAGHNSRGGGAAATIKVQKGDTLWTLAKSHLGRSSAWPCLATANPSLRDPNLIYTGQSLVLPTACSSSPTNSPSRASP